MPNSKHGTLKVKLSKSDASADGKQGFSFVLLKYVNVHSLVQHVLDFTIISKVDSKYNMIFIISQEICTPGSIFSWEISTPLGKSTLLYICSNSDSYDYRSQSLIGIFVEVQHGVQ